MPRKGHQGNTAETEAKLRRLSTAERREIARLLVVVSSRDEVLKMLHEQGIRLSASELKYMADLKPKEYRNSTGPGEATTMQKCDGCGAMVRIIPCRKCRETARCPTCGDLQPGRTKGKVCDDCLPKTESNCLGCGVKLNAAKSLLCSHCFDKMRWSQTKAALKLG